MAKVTSQPSIATGTSSPAPLSGPLATALDLIGQVVTALASVLLPTIKDVRKVLKIRQKAVPLIPQLLKLAIAEPKYAPTGSDPAALLAQWTLAVQLQEVLTPVSALHTQLGGTVLQLQAQVWKTVTIIYALASADTAGDATVLALVAQMKAALKVGPQKQKSVHTAIAPTPMKGKKAKKALLAAPVLEAAKAQVGQPGSTPAPAPAVATPPAPGPASSGGGS